MLAGLGTDSLSGLGSTTAVLLSGRSSSAGIVLGGGSPTPGSASGSSGSQPNGPVLLGGSGSGSGSSTGGSSSSTPNGPVLLGGTGSGTGSTTSGASAPIFVPGGLVFFVKGESGPNAAGSSVQQGSGGSTTQSPSDSGATGRITPLVYNPQSDGPPVFHSGVWTEDGGTFQYVPVADPTGGRDGESPPAGRPTWNDVKDDYPGPRWWFEFEAEMGRYDPPKEAPKPRDELDGVVPTDPNGTYTAGDTQKFDTLPTQVAEKGKEFAWFMAEWLGPDEAANIAKPIIAGGKGLAVIAFGAGRADDGADALNAARKAFLAGKTIPELKEFTSALPWNQLWGRGAPGAIEALGKLQNGGKILPDGISRESLEAYAELARRALADPQSATDVQRIRLQIIEEILRGM